MYQETLKFIETNKNEEPLKVLIQLSSISEIKRATSMVMYSSIVLNMGVGSPLWFSSFENRNHVIQTVEHFWREQLLGKSDTERFVKSLKIGIATESVLWNVSQNQRLTFDFVYFPRNSILDRVLNTLQKIPIHRWWSHVLVNVHVDVLKLAH